MYLLLGNRLRDQNRVSLNFKSLLEQRFTGNLSAHIVGIDFRITFQAIIPIISLHAQDGVNSHGVGITSNGGANNRKASAYSFPNHLINFIEVHLLGFDFSCFHLRIVKGRYGSGVDNKIGKVVCNLP